MPTLAKLAEIRTEIGNLKAEMDKVAVAIFAMEKVTADLCLKFIAANERVSILARDVSQLAETFQ